MQRKAAQTSGGFSRASFWLRLAGRLNAVCNTAGPVDKVSDRQTLPCPANPASTRPIAWPSGKIGLPRPVLMRNRVLTLSFPFVMVTLLSAPWLRSDDQGVPHYNAAPAKGDKLEPILTKDQLWGE